MKKVYIITMHQANYKKAPFLTDNNEFKISAKNPKELEDKIFLAKKHNITPNARYYMSYENGNGIQQQNFQIKKTSEEPYEEAYLSFLVEIKTILMRENELLKKEIKLTTNEVIQKYLKDKVSKIKDEIYLFDTQIFLYS